MQASSIPTTKWAAELRTLLRGDLTNASLSIPAEHADSYEALKTALLTRMGVTTASRFELWFEPKSKGNETMAHVFHRTLDVGIACLKECESVEECAKLVTTELMYKLMAPNISALIRAQKPANTTEFVQAADLYISGSRLDRSKLWDQRGGRQHFTPYRYPFKEQQPSSPQIMTALSASPQFRQSNQLSQPTPQPTNHSNSSRLFKKDRRHLQQKRRHLQQKPHTQ